MPLNAYKDYIKNERIPEQFRQEMKKYIDKETDRNNKIIEELKVGGSEDYNSSISLFPIGKIQSPVRIPTWMFRKFPDHKSFELDDIEKVAMAHVIHFTNCDNPTGYIECSGHIENWCKCSVQEAHDALTRLVKRNLIKSHVLAPEFCMGHKRNLGYFVNIGYVHTILNLYKTDIWL
jgi:hypothetical protein